LLFTFYTHSVHNVKSGPEPLPSLLPFVPHHQKA
jgi:hypothetical protein